MRIKIKARSKEKKMTQTFKMHGIASMYLQLKKFQANLLITNVSDFREHTSIKKRCVEHITKSRKTICDTHD